MAKALIVAAPASGNGKTVITLGLLRALRKRGVRVAAAKTGPDYIDPRFHEAATGRSCFNLDPWAMPPGLLGSLLSDLAVDSDLVVIEGVMGLFDGPRGAPGSTADLAALFDLPVILCVDARHQAQSLAALVHGFSTYRQDVQIAGLILNRVSSDRHAAVLGEAVGRRVIGMIRQHQSLGLPSRHLGLVQAEENQELEQFIESAATIVERETDLDAVIAAATPAQGGAGTQTALPPLGQSIAVASDRAFAFAYPHMLHHWRRAGASIIPFSPLADEPPAAAADAVFLPGGYPELHAGRLAASHRFMAGLRAATGPIYGECGGFMVLGEALVDAAGDRHAMAGLLPVTTSFAKRQLHLGYRRLRPLPGALWSNHCRGHEFHYSTIANESDTDRLFAASDAAGNELGDMGLRRGKVMGSYAHIICEAP